MLKFFQNKSIMLIMTSFLLILIGGEAIYYFSSQDPKEELVSENIVPEATEEPKKKLSVDLKGAVKEPKVYSLEEGSTLADLITEDLLTSNAELKNINLSMLLTDGLVIEIPVKEKTNSTTTSSKKGPSNNTQTNTSVASKVETNSSNKVTIESSKSTVEKEKEEEEEAKPLIVNINTADATELTKLNGIGEAKAKAIISYRNSNGPFEKKEDILNVKGIGESIYAKIKDFITV